MLVRKLISSRLSSYYAQSSEAVVGSTDVVSNTSLSLLLGEWHWKRVYRQAYQQQQGHWLTPVELFKPYYSNCMADFLNDTAANYDADCNIRVVEVGCGRGTNAVLFMDHLKATQPEIYKRTSYTVVDSSPTLHKVQCSTLQKSQHESNKFDVELVDLINVAEGRASLLPYSTDLTVLFALEVFDNLPHDKIKAFSREHVQQTQIVKLRDGVYKEEYKMLSDSLLQDTLSINPEYIQRPVSWVPTVACGLLKHIVEVRPNLGVVVADFDSLPPSDAEPPPNTVLAYNEPLVTSLDGQDYPSYLTAPPMCDILFPTDFSKLTTYLKNITHDRQKVIRLYKQHEFLQSFGPNQVNKTKSWFTGYSPMLDDFGNCSVLTMTPSVTA